MVTSLAKALLNSTFSSNNFAFVFILFHFRLEGFIQGSKKGRQYICLSSVKVVGKYKNVLIYVPEL